MIPWPMIRELFRIFFPEDSGMTVILLWHEFLPQFLFLLFIDFDRQLLCNCAFTDDKVLPYLVAWYPSGECADPEWCFSFSLWQLFF